MAVDQKQILLDALRVIKDTPPAAALGICPNIDYATLYVENCDDYAVQMLFKGHAKSWPLYSGDCNYPVPATTDISASAAYYRADNMWKGEYGSLRKQLLDFVILALEKELNA